MVNRLGRSGRLNHLLTVAVTTLLIVVASTAPARAETVRQQQWYLDAWKIEEAWAVSQGAGVTVAVVDTGVNGNLEDLRGQVLPGPYGEGDDPAQQHGTGMASLIVGTGRSQSGQGMYGVAPKAKVLPYKLPNSGGALLPWDTTRAIKDAADSEAKIISLSLAGSSREPSNIEVEAVRYAQSRGKLVVAAAGNLDSGTVPAGRAYPAALPGVLGVSAYGRDGSAWSGAERGDWVSVAGPGVDIVAACEGPGGAVGYCKGDGTSTATALVSGVAALVWSVHPDWTANQVVKRLIDTANKPSTGAVPNDFQGYGNVSPRKALQSTDPPGPPDVNPLVGNRGDKPTAPPSPTASPTATAPTPATTTPDAPNPSSPGTQPPLGNAADDADDSGSNTPLIAAAAVGGLLLLAVLAYLVIRSRRGNGPPAPPAAPPYAQPPPQPPNTRPPPAVR